MMASCSDCADSARVMSGWAFILILSGWNDHFPACALRAVLDCHSFGGEFVADAICFGEIAALACIRALIQQALDPRGIDGVRRTFEPLLRIDLQQSEESAGAEQCRFCSLLVLWICGFPRLVGEPSQH